MPDERYDVFLFGFRNDLARARTIAFLDRLPSAATGPARLGARTEYPVRLFAGVPVEAALPLQAALTDLGAQVAVLAATPSTRGVVESPPPAPSVAPRAATNLRPLTLALAVALGATVYLWQTGVPLPHLPLRRRRPRRPRPVMPPSRPSRASRRRPSG